MRGSMRGNMNNKQYVYSVSGQIIVKAETREAARKKLVEKLQDHRWLTYDSGVKGQGHVVGDFEDLPD